MKIDFYNRRLWLAAIALMAMMLAACSDDKDNPTPIPPDPVEQRLAEMTLREKVGQMFIIRPEALRSDMGDMHDVVDNAMTQLTSDMTATDNAYPAGGIILFAHNILDPNQITTFTKQLHTLPDDPLLCIVPDLWGELVVVSRGQEPFDTRLATPSDKRKAIIYKTTPLCGRLED